MCVLLFLFLRYCFEDFQELWLVKFSIVCQHHFKLHSVSTDCFSIYCNLYLVVWLCSGTSKYQ